jgi:hypothetical protein
MNMAEAKQDQSATTAPGISTSSASQPKQAQPAPSQPKASGQRSDNSGQDYDPTQGVGDELQARHEQRVTVPGYPNVDARLDNRSGVERPPLEEFPAKPQQIDGPDVMGQIAHTRETLQSREDPTDRKGMFSPGPHGLSDERVRVSDTVFGPDDLPASSKAG